MTFSVKTFLTALDPANYNSMLRNQQIQQKQDFQKNQLLAKTIIEGVQNGAIPPEEAGPALKRLGYGDLTTQSNQPPANLENYGGGPPQQNQTVSLATPLGKRVNATLNGQQVPAIQVATGQLLNPSSMQPMPNAMALEQQGRSPYILPHDLSVPDGKGGFVTKAVLVNTRTKEVTPLNYPGQKDTISPKDKSVQGGVSSAKAQGGVVGKAEGTAKINLANADYQAQRTLELTNKLANDKGLDYLTGGKSYIPGKLKGPWIAQAQSYIDQLKGMGFLNVYQNTLKGGGQITEVEGAKGTAAIQRMQSILDNHGSKAEFLNALHDYQSVVHNMLKISKKQASGDFSPLSSGSNQLSPEDQQALDWAKANPNDPRAQKIMEHINGL